MNDELFNELIESIEESGAIKRGEIAPSRSHHIDAAAIRELRLKHKLSQQKFASFMGISVATLRNWEQGRRRPEGPAQVLLQIAQKRPDAIWDVEDTQATENKTQDKGGTRITVRKSKRP